MKTTSKLAIPLGIAAALTAGRDAVHGRDRLATRVADQPTIDKEPATCRPEPTTSTRATR